MTGRKVRSRKEPTRISSTARIAKIRIHYVNIFSCMISFVVLDGGSTERLTQPCRRCSCTCWLVSPFLYSGSYLVVGILLSFFSSVCTGLRFGMFFGITIPSCINTGSRHSINDSDPYFLNLHLLYLKSYPVFCSSSGSLSCVRMFMNSSPVIVSFS